jgi:membrane protein
MAIAPLREFTRGAGAIFVEAGRRWSADACYRLGAALSYYAIFSLFPILLLLATGLGYALGNDAAPRRELLDWLTGATGSPAVRSLLDDSLASLQAHHAARGVGAAVGVVTLLFGASGVFSELDSALNTIWRVRDPESLSFWQDALLFVKRKGWSFLLVLCAIVIAVGSWLVGAAAAAMGDATRGLLPWWPSGAVLGGLALDAGASIVILTAALAVMFHALPRTRVTWGDVAPGALIAALLLTGLKRLLVLYLVHLGGYAAYGAIGAILGLMMLLYVASLIVLFGAELTRVFAERFGSLSHRSVAVAPNVLSHGA